MTEQGLIYNIQRKNNETSVGVGERAFSQTKQNNKYSFLNKSIKIIMTTKFFEQVGRVFYVLPRVELWYTTG